MSRSSSSAITRRASNPAPVQSIRRSASRSRSRRSSAVSTSNRHIPRNIYSTVVRIFAHRVRYETPYSVVPAPDAFGTGFFVDGEGRILTCAHVIEKAIEVEVEIATQGRGRLKATVLGSCPVLDLAMLRVEGYTNTEWCDLDDGTGRVRVRPGDTAMVVGFPLGASNLKQTKGVISGQQENWYQTDAPINPGNSGGPLFKDDVVVGVNAAFGTRNGTDVEGVGYAVPIARYMLVKELLMQEKRVVHFPKTFGFEHHTTYPDWLKYVGCDCSAATDAPQNGVYVTHVQPDSLVSHTGLRKGDIVCRLGGYDIDSFGELPRRWMNQKMTLDNLLFTLRMGEKVEIEYWTPSKAPKEHKAHTAHKRVQRRVVKHFVMREHSAAVRTVYPTLENVDYAVAGGMVIAPLTLNHVEMWLPHGYPPRLLKYDKSTNRALQKLIMVNALAGSFVAKCQMLDELGPYVIEKVNGRAVKTVGDFRKAFRTPVVGADGRAYVELRTEDDVLLALPVDALQEEEERLQEKHKYPEAKIVRATNAGN